MSTAYERYEAKLAAEKAEGQRQVDEFNRRYPIGTPVIAYPGIRPEDPLAVAWQKRVEEGRVFGGMADPCHRLKTVTRTPAWTLGHGEPVVSVEGYAGGIRLAHIDVEHQQVPVWVGGIDCLERECDDYYDEDGNDRPSVESCSHLREETACSCQRDADGFYDTKQCTADEAVR